MDYILPKPGPDVVRRICEKYKVDFLAANIFARRGITHAEDIKYYLESGINYLHSPFLFKDMEEAVERILACAEEKEKIAIFGDRDADGITSTALLAAELRSMGIEVFTHLPQGDEPYGLSSKAVEQIISEGAGLVITVDNGITAIKEIEALNNAGIDTIVTDHHLPGDALPDALAVLDPKVSSCGYPFEHLAGCAVTSKLIWALRFASSPLYKSHVILLHAEPGPGEDTTTIVQAVELYNLVEVSRVIEELPNRAVDFENSKLVRLLMRALPVLVLDRETELRQLRMAFGPSVDISLVELRGELEAVIPRVRGRSLFTLTTESRQALYADGHEEIETLVSLFTSCCIYKYPSLSRDFIHLLDLVAIGTIADLMPMTDENRIMVKLGLKELEKGTRDSLIQLLSAQNLATHPLSASDIGWYVSPVINSAGRLGTPDIALNLILSQDPAVSFELTRQLLELNTQRQKMGETIWSAVEKSAKDSLESFGSKFIVIDDKSVPRGLTGAVCTRALKEFPDTPAVIVMAETDDDRISGSIRSRNSLNCKDFLSRFASILQDYGGHKAAGGFSLEKERKAEFLKALDEEVLAMDTDQNEESIAVDALINERDMSLSLISTIELFEPYGEACQPLVFMCNEAQITDIITLGDPTKGNVKLMLRIGRNIWPALWWGARKDPGFSYAAGDRIHIIFKLSRNYYKGSGTVQLTLLDVKAAE